MDLFGKPLGFMPNEYINANRNENVFIDYVKNLAKSLNIEIIYKKINPIVSFLNNLRLIKDSFLFQQYYYVLICLAALIFQIIGPCRFHKYNKAGRLINIYFYIGGWTLHPVHLFRSKKKKKEDEISLYHFVFQSFFIEILEKENVFKFNSIFLKEKFYFLLSTFKEIEDYIEKIPDTEELNEQAIFICNKIKEITDSSLQ